MGADLFVTSGAAAGALGLLSVVDDIAVFGPGGAESIVQLRPGDTVHIDNSGYLAAQTYHRHQVPEAGQFDVWDQFRNPDGSPMYPQRPLLLGPLFAAAAAGTVQTGRFEGKMIVVESLLDREALPWQADWYRARVHEHFGDATRRAFPTVVHGQCPARRRRDPGEPDPYGELSRHAAASTPGPEPMGGGGGRAPVQHQLRRRRRASRRAS